jgi:hypothetical protein
VPREATEIHTRLLKLALEMEDSRAYWAAADGSPRTPERAFNAYWFGARSLAQVKNRLLDFRHRYDAFPDALDALHAWPHMGPDTRALVCHWHLQLADPLYRRFTGSWLPSRLRPEVSRDLVARWVHDQEPARWTPVTRLQFASKLLSAAHGAGIVRSTRDPRLIAAPRVPDDALAYLVHLLRGVEFEGTLLDNPYARSVGLDPPVLTERLRTLASFDFRVQGGLVDFGWQ